MKTNNAQEAWDFLQKDEKAVLVDVRTPEEWALVGQPDTGSIGRKFVPLTWSMEQEAEFVQALEQAVPDKASPLFFICRGGMRSQRAAYLALAAGYSDVTNIGDGFESAPGASTGWKACGLPVK